LVQGRGKCLQANLERERVRRLPTLPGVFIRNLVAGECASETRWESVPAGRVHMCRRRECL
jgi:hypothetical protein